MPRGHFFSSSVGSVDMHVRACSSRIRLSGAECNHFGSMVWSSQLATCWGFQVALLPRVHASHHEHTVLVHGLEGHS
jgi:hypothetical protein